MENAMHIPGPWEAHTETGSPPFVTQEGTTSGWVCQTLTWCGMDVAKANARLIAAAPDMLLALDDIANGRLGVTDAMLESREAMMSALAKYCQERARVALSDLDQGTMPAAHGNQAEQATAVEAKVA